MEHTQKLLWREHKILPNLKQSINLETKQNASLAYFKNEIFNGPPKISSHIDITDFFSGIFKFFFASSDRGKCSEFLLGVTLARSLRSTVPAHAEKNLEKYEHVSSFFYDLESERD